MMDTPMKGSPQPAANSGRLSLLRLRHLLLAASVVTFLLIVMGYVVRSSDSSLACPDWPTCYGQLGIPSALSLRLEVIHRGQALLSFVLVGAAAVMARRRFHPIRWLSRPLYLALGVIALQIGVGAGLVWLNAQPVISAVHLGLALTAFMLVLCATVTSFYFAHNPEQADRLAYRTPFARLSRSTLAALLGLMVSGVLAAGLSESAACQGWPLCAGGLPVSALGWLEFGHRLLTAATAALVGMQLVSAWHSQRSQQVMLTAATGVFFLFTGQVLIGAVKVSRGFPVDLVGLHAASAAALLGVQVVLVVAAGLTARSPQEEQIEAQETLLVGQRLRDFFLLSKPVIVALLLVTTYAGMVIGGGRLPQVAMTFWTLLGGALAAGGASALNQYIDREIDRAMQRTAHRPLPAGRLKPAEGLAYGLGAMLLAFFLLAGFVNLLSALLALAGMIYYVLIYSIWLKKMTVQNIVIGGGAGAIPPLVGWAAASGSLNISSLFLFAIIFLWTPPHFWALALVRSKDYARAGIPMLPVVHGERATRWQILLYTIELVALTLLMPILKIAGSLFLILALVLGAWLLSAAWRLYRHGGNKVAWKMYRYSSMYLGLIFLALVVDVLI